MGETGQTPELPDDARAAGYRAFVAAMNETVVAGEIYARTIDAFASAWLAGRTVVQLPEPDGEWFDGTLWWDLRHSATGVTVLGGQSFITADGAPEWLDAAEATALAVLAAVRVARRLAAESSGDGAL